MIYVFKTSVQTKTQADKLIAQLNKIQSVLRSNFDLEDSDRILRIDSIENLSATITALLQRQHLFCEEIL
ncbi:MAG: hypothetical protein JST81_00750 [Bacteroidetes bacterium]|nr:hypothetical protein [Bacteroidota bacterium]